MLIRFDIEQGSDEWHDLRGGKFSSTKASCLIGSDQSSGYLNLIKDIAWFRCYRKFDNASFQTESTKRGHRLEPEARNHYIFQTKTPVIEAGFVTREGIEDCGWSPDGLIMDKGKLIAGIEIKCLEHRAHMEIQKSLKVPKEYFYQTQWALWVGGLQWLDFVAYHPTANEKMIIIRCYKNKEVANRFENRLIQARKDVNEWVAIQMPPASEIKF